MRIIYYPINLTTSLPQLLSCSKIMCSRWRRVTIKQHSTLVLLIFLAISKVVISEILISVADLRFVAGVGRSAVVSPAPKYLNLPGFPSFPTPNYSEFPSNNLHERLSALHLPLQTLDRHLEPSPRFQTPQLRVSDSS